MYNLQIYKRPRPLCLCKFHIRVRCVHNETQFMFVLCNRASNCNLLKLRWWGPYFCEWNTILEIKINRPLFRHFRVCKKSNFILHISRGPPLKYVLKLYLFRMKGLWWCWKIVIDPIQEKRSTFSASFVFGGVESIKILVLFQYFSSVF